MELLINLGDIEGPGPIQVSGMVVSSVGNRLTTEHRRARLAKTHVDANVPLFLGSNNEQRQSSIRVVLALMLANSIVSRRRFAPWILPGILEVMNYGRGVHGNIFLI